MNVFIEPEEHAFSEHVTKALRVAVALLGQPEGLDVEVNFLSPQEMRELNAATRSVDAVTDVLSFPTLSGIRGRVLRAADYPTDVDPETGNLMLGSIAVCPERAVEQAAEYGHSVAREVCYLAVHGLLHLLDYDHMTEPDKRQMREKEEAVLSALSLGRDA